MVESAAARVCRKAGARVSLNVRVQDMDLARPDVMDNRRLEIVADGLPLFHGAQLAVDATVVSVLKHDGTPHPHCADVDGAAMQAARRRKETISLEFGGQFGRARLVVLGCEVAGRWSDKCLSFLRQLARAKVRSEPPHVKVRARRAWLSRWSIMLSCSAARAIALSLLERRGATDRTVRPRPRCKCWRMPETQAFVCILTFSKFLIVQSMAKVELAKVVHSFSCSRRADRPHFPSRHLPSPFQPTSGSILSASVNWQTFVTSRILLHLFAIPRSALFCVRFCCLSMNSNGRTRRTTDRDTTTSQVFPHDVAPTWRQRQMNDLRSWDMKNLCSICSSFGDIPRDNEIVPTVDILSISPFVFGHPAAFTTPSVIMMRMLPFRA